tara:strand:+ start:460 stop:792 length:333 start_codon:yes stop_codon:yes gene_type:complete
MSTIYQPLKDLSYKKVKKLCPEIEFVKASNADNSWGEVMCINSHYLHFHDYKNKITAFTRYGQNNVEKIINLIQFRLATPIYDEHSPEFEQMHLENLTEKERKEFLGEPS